jgi:hypothetical protein
VLANITIETDTDTLTGAITAIRLTNGSDRAAKLSAVDQVTGLRYLVEIAPGESGGIRPTLPLVPDGYAYGRHFDVGRSKPGSVGVPDGIASGIGNQPLTLPTAGTVTPTGGALLVVFGMGRRGTNRTLDTVVDTFNAGGSHTWNEVYDIASAEGVAALRAFNSFWWTECVAAPDPGVVVLTWSGGLNSLGFLLEIAGSDVAAPISEQATGTQTSGTTASAPLVGVAPANRSLAGVANIDTAGSGGITAGTGETEGEELIGDQVTGQWQYGTDPGDDATPDWTTLLDEAAAFGAVEIAAAEDEEPAEPEEGQIIIIN